METENQSSNQIKKVEVYRSLTNDFKPTFEIKNPELLLEEKINIELKIHSFEEKSQEELRVELTNYINCHLEPIGITKHVDKNPQIFGCITQSSIEEIMKKYDELSTDLDALKPFNLLKLKKSKSHVCKDINLKYNMAIISGATIITDYLINQNLDYNPILLAAEVAIALGASTVFVLSLPLGLMQHATEYIEIKEQCVALEGTIKQYHSVLENITNATIKLDLNSDAKQIYAQAKANSEARFVHGLNITDVNKALMSAYTQK